MYQKGDNVVLRKTFSDKRKTMDRKLLHFITLLPCYTENPMAVVLGVLDSRSKLIP